MYNSFANTLCAAHTCANVHRNVMWNCKTRLWIVQAKIRGEYLYEYVLQYQQTQVITERNFRSYHKPDVNKYNEIKLISEF